jgi:hypothetical protein
MAKRSRRIKKGSRTSTPVRPREVLKRLTLNEAMLASADPAEAAEMRRLEAAGYSTHIIFAGGTETESDRIKSRFLDMRIRANRQLKARLATGELVATGRDPTDPFSPRRLIPPDRWRYLEVDYDRSAVVADQVWIVEVEVSLDGALHISRRFTSASLGMLPLVLSDRSFDLLLMLAERVKEPFVPLGELNKRFYEKATNPKGLNQGMDELKEHLKRSGISPETVEQIVINIRGKGYCLNMPATEVLIDD